MGSQTADKTDPRLKELRTGLKAQEQKINPSSFEQGSSDHQISVDSQIPQLAWIVRRTEAGFNCTVGRSVDVFDDTGFFEGVWAGPFADFSTALGSETYGSGVSFAQMPPVFIQRKDVREFTFILKDRETHIDRVSNSLCYVLQDAQIAPTDPLFQALAKDLVSSTFEEGKKGFHMMDPLVAKTDRYEFYRLCYSNFWFHDDGSIEFDKNPVLHDFKDWNDYKSFLLETTRSVFANGADPARILPLSPLGSVSRGYDSPAVSALAKHCGCDQAVTLDVPEDNGSDIAAMLGMRPLVFPHVLGRSRKAGLRKLNRKVDDTNKAMSYEFIATAGIGDDVNSLAFESVLPGALFLTGVGGDGNWQKNADPILGLKKAIPQSTSLTEFRLRVGFAHFPPILCGSVCTGSVVDIANSPDMKAFSLDQEYDRPIARRFAEEAGVLRDAFGMNKMAQNPKFTNANAVWEEAVIHTMKRYAPQPLQSDGKTDLNHKEIVYYSKAATDPGAPLSEPSKKPAFTIQDVIDRDMCIGCGACAVATAGKVAMEVNDKGMLCANADDVKSLTPAKLKRADAVCPFSDAAQNENQLAPIDAQAGTMPHDASVGYHNALLAGREKDDTQVVGSSSGGLTSWLLKKLIETKRVDGVIHVGNMDGGDRMFGYRISFSSEEIDQHRKSFYYSTTLSDVLQEAKTHKSKTFAIVGVPCFIKSARLLAEQDKALKTRLKYFVGIVCGHMKSAQFAQSNAWQLGVPPQDVDRVDFRVKVPNKKSSQYQFAVDPKGGQDRVAGTPSKLLGGSWGHAFFQPNACNYCDDVFAETADVVFGDAWLPGYSEDWRGANIIATRNDDLAQVLQSGMDSDEIGADNLPLETIIASQAGGLRHRRQGLRVRLKDDLDAGLKVPVKRVPAEDSDIPLWRKKVIRQRKRMSEKSFEHFKEAKTTGDLSRFTTPMKDEVAVYKYLDKHRYPTVGKKKQFYDIALFGWHHQANLGGVLTVFALHQILEKLGLKVVVIWRPRRASINAGNKPNHDILKKFYTYSKFRRPRRLHQLRKFCNTFVLASDQLWAGKWIPFHPEYEFLGAGDDTVKKISVATSFGGDGTALPFKGDQAAIVSHLMREMDHISVREPAGVGIVESTGAQATQILDPVFLCPPETYQTLMDHADVDLGDTDYVMSYVLDAQKDLVDFATNTVTKACGVKDAYFMTTMQNSDDQSQTFAKWNAFKDINFLPHATFADFVYGISRSSFVFTDSFHGACMALLFHKPFICCPKGSRGQSRFELFRLLGLEDRIMDRAALDVDVITRPIDWDEVDKRLNAMRKTSFAWLSNAFERDFSEIESSHTNPR